jgi:NACalpha-BTF3-like transcription factor
VMSNAGCSSDEAASALAKSRGVIAEAMELIRKLR